MPPRRWSCAPVRAIAATLLLGVAWAGCADPKLAQLESVRAQVCRCDSAACVDAALAKLPAKEPRDAPRARAIAAEIQRCIVELGERAPAELSAPAPAAPAPSPADPASDGAR